jgi:hypothetical protein
MPHFTDTQARITALPPPAPHYLTCLGRYCPTLSRLPLQTRRPTNERNTGPLRRSRRPRRGSEACWIGLSRSLQSRCALGFLTKDDMHPLTARSLSGPHLRVLRRALWAPNKWMQQSRRGGRKMAQADLASVDSRLAADPPCSADSGVEHRAATGVS